MISYFKKIFNNHNKTQSELIDTNSTKIESKFDIKTYFNNIKDLIENDKVNQLPKEFKEYLLLSFQIYESNSIYKQNENEFYNLKNLLIKESKLAQKINDLNITTYVNESNHFLQSILLDDGNPNTKFEANKDYDLKKIDLNIVFSNLIKYFVFISEDLNLDLNKDEVKLVLNDFLKFNTINTIEFKNLNQFIIGTNVFQNLAKEEQLLFLKEFKTIGKYTSSDAEKRLVKPAEKLLKEEIDMGMSQEAKAWFSLILKFSKDKSNIALKAELDNVLKLNSDLKELSAIKELDKALSGASLSKLVEIDFKLPNGLNDLAIDYLITKMDKITNLIDVITSMDQKALAEYISKGFSDLAELTDVMTNQSLSLASIKTIFSFIPEKYKEIFPYYKDIKKQLNDLNNLLTKKVTDVVHIEDIKKSLNNYLGVLAHSKDDLLKNLNNQNINSMSSIITRVGTQHYDKINKEIMVYVENIRNDDNFQIDKKAIKEKLNQFNDEDLNNKINFSNLTKEQQNEIIKVVKSFDDFTTNLSNEDIIKGLSNNFEKYQEDLLNGNAYIKYLYKTLNEHDSNTLSLIIKGNLPTNEDMISLLKNNEFNSKYFKIEDNIQTILNNNFFKQDEISFDFHRSTFLNTLSAQIDEASVPNYKKNYYLDSFVSINKDDASIVFSKNPLEDMAKKQNLLDLSLYDIEVSIVANKNNPTILKKLEKTKETLYILKDIVEINTLINSGNAMFLDFNINSKDFNNDVLKYLSNKFDLNRHFKDFDDSITYKRNLVPIVAENKYIQNLREVFGSKVNLLIDNIKENSFQNYSLNKELIHYESSKEKFANELITKHKYNEIDNVTNIHKVEINAILRNKEAPDTIKELNIDSKSKFFITKENVNNLLKMSDKEIINFIANDEYEFNQYIGYELGNNYQFEVMDPKMNIRLKEIVKNLINNPNILLEQLTYCSEFNSKINSCHKDDIDLNYLGVSHYSNEILFLNYINNAKDIDNKGIIDIIIDEYFYNNKEINNNNIDFLNKIDPYILKLMYITNYDKKNILNFVSSSLIYENGELNKDVLFNKEIFTTNNDEEIDNITHINNLPAKEQNLHKFITTNNNELLEKCILHSISKTNKNNFEIEKLAFKGIYTFNENNFKINKIYNKKDIEFLTETYRGDLSNIDAFDYFSTMHNYISLANMKDNKILNLNGLTINDLLNINKSTYAKKYLIDNFSSSMDNPLDHFIIQSLKNGTLENSLKNKSDEELDILRSSFKAYQLKTIGTGEYNYMNDEKIMFLESSYIQEKTWFGLIPDCLDSNNEGLYELIYSEFNEYMQNNKNVNDLLNIVCQENMNHEF